MKRYWFEFHFNDDNKIPYGLLIGCGVTAFSYEDAIQIIQEKIFAVKKIPEIKKKIEAVDVSNLDQDHVIPNMRPPTERGVWFPIGYN